MSDPKWKERLIPVMNDAVIALSCLLSGDLFDKLLERGCVNAEQHENFIKHMKGTMSDHCAVARDLLMLLRRRPHPSFSKFCSVIQKFDGGSDLLHILTPAKESTQNVQGSPGTSSADEDEGDILNVLVVERLKEAYEPCHKRVVNLVKDITKITENRSKELQVTLSYVPSMPISNPCEKQVGRNFVIYQQCELKILFPKTKPEYFEKQKDRLLGTFSSLLNYTTIKILKESCYVRLTLTGMDFVTFLCDLQDRTCLIPLIEFDPDVEIQFSCLLPFKVVCLLGQKSDPILDDHHKRETDLQKTIDDYERQSRKQFAIIKAQIQEKKRVDAKNANLANELKKVMALREKEKKKQAQDDLESKKLLGELTKLRMDYAEIACQLRGEKQEREREQRDSVRVQLSLKAENANLLKKLERESSDRTEVSSQLIALQVTLRKKEENIKLQRKQNDADSERLHGELTKLRTDRDKLVCQLSDERQERDREQKDAVGEKVEVQKRLIAEKASLAGQLERERSDMTKISVELIALRKMLREKEEIIEIKQKQNHADSERLHGELKKVRTDHDDLESQLRDEREARLRDNEDAVREIMRVEQRLEAETASLADQLERERSDKRELTTELIKTLEEKDETIELQQKQNDAVSERLLGEQRKLEIDRDELTFQLRNLQAEIASFADQLEREKRNKKELSAELIALRKTVIEKEETFELKQKQNDDDFEKLRGELRKLRTERDDLKSQLRQEREGRHKERHSSEYMVSRNSKDLASCEERKADDQQYTDHSQQPKTDEASSLKIFLLRRKGDVVDKRTSDVEEISDSRRPSEMAKRFSDLFNFSYDLFDRLCDVSKDERECNKFILHVLATTHKAAAMRLTRVGEELVQVADLHGYVDNISAKKTIIECAVLLCKMSNRINDQSCSWIWHKAVSFQTWRRKLLMQRTSALLKSADAFLEKCVPVCWDLVLQKRPLLLVTDHAVFNWSLHERFRGSDTKSIDIDQFVWPCLVEEGTNRVLVKGKVVTEKRGERQTQKCK